jgi:hypothetical protein
VELIRDLHDLASVMTAFPSYSILSINCMACGTDTGPKEVPDFDDEQFGQESVLMLPPPRR